jgi:tetratricopeptide (TPR) repeat protein
MGIVLAGMGRVDEAQAKYLDAIRLDPDNADAHYYLGSTLLMKGKTSEAIEHIREAIRVKPDNGNYRYGLGVVLSGTGKLDEAEKEFSEALRISPNIREGLEGTRQYNDPQRQLRCRNNVLQQGAGHKPKPGRRS